jgi:hypothetical protein
MLSAFFSFAPSRNPLPARHSPHVVSESTMGKVELALAMHFGF